MILTTLAMLSTTLAAHGADPGPAALVPGKMNIQFKNVFTSDWGLPNPADCAVDFTTAKTEDGKPASFLTIAAGYPSMRYEVILRFLVTQFPAKDLPAVEIAKAQAPMSALAAVFGGDGGAEFAPMPSDPDSFCSLHASWDAASDKLMGDVLCQNVRMSDPFRPAPSDDKTPPSTFSSQGFACPVNRTGKPLF